MTMNVGKILVRRENYDIGVEVTYLLSEAVATLTFRNLFTSKNIDIDRTITIDAAFIC